MGSFIKPRFYALCLAICRIPGMREYVQKLERKMAVLLPMEPYGLRLAVMGQMVRNLAVFLAVSLTAWLLAGGRVCYLIAGIAAGAMAADNRFRNYLRRLEEKELGQLGAYLGGLRQVYGHERDVEGAIYEAWAEAGEEWRLHLSIMEESFFSGDLPENYRIARPPSLFLAFLALCQSGIRYGEEDGDSVFLSDLEELQRSVELSRLQMERERSLYQCVFPGLLLPGLCLPVMERWGMAQVPELRNFYYESAGSLTRILVYLMSWISLRVFSGLRKTVAEELELGKRPAEFMRRFLAGWNQMEGRFGRFTAEVYQRLAPGRSVERFYRKRVLAAAFAAVTGSLWCVVYGSRGGGIVCWLTVWLLVVPAASFLPYVDLMIAGIFYPDQAETEVSLYRFVTLCLSRVSTMTVERILERMELFGFYFQAEVSEWLDRGLVLPETLSDKGWQSDIPESLRELLRNFLAADRVGLKEIGKNVALQRDFQLARDRQRLELSAGKREAWIQLILFLPFGTAVAAYLILPFLGQGMNSLMSFTGGGIM